MLNHWGDFPQNINSFLTDLRANQWTGFYMITASVMKEWKQLLNNFLGRFEMKNGKILVKLRKVWYYKTTFKLHVAYNAFHYCVKFNIWDKVFKNGQSKICGRHSLKNLKWCGLPWIVCPIFWQNDPKSKMRNWKNDFWGRFLLIC